MLHSRIHVRGMKVGWTVFSVIISFVVIETYSREKELFAASSSMVKRIKSVVVIQKTFY